jgi:hypothetical protein
MRKEEVAKVNDFKKSVLDPLIKVNQDDVIVRSNCKLCSTDIRFEAEEYWEDNDFNYSKTLRWLNEQVDNYNLTRADDDMEMIFFTIANVKCHMKNHFKEQERQLRLKEYASNIESLIDAKREKIDILDFALAACQENLSRVASVETYGSLKGETTRADAVNKVINQMLNVIKAQTELNGDVNAIDLVQEKVADIWIQMIGEEENEAKKKIYVHMLEEFSEKFKDLENDG